CLQSASLVTSSLMKCASPPIARISASTLRPSTSRMSPSTTFARSFANSRASTAPMPRAAPLINATLPSSLIVSGPRDELRDLGHVGHPLEMADGVDEGGGLGRPEDRGGVAAEFLADLVPREGVGGRPLVRPRAQRVALA